MRQNYFVVNGERYYTGTVFITNYMGVVREATFICYDTESKHYAYKTEHQTWRMPEETFHKFLVDVTNKINNNVHMPITKKKKDFDINGMFIGWVWYIFLMLIFTIFNHAILWWILTSIVFFSWRSEKIKKEGTYIEW